MLVPALRDVRAVVFDTDGVITDSARVHAAAWKTAFDTHLDEHPPEDPGLRRPFDPQDDYLRYVDGRSASTVPRPSSPLAAWTHRRGRYRPSRRRRNACSPGVCASTASTRSREPFDWYAPCARRVPCAAASASRHAGELLGRAGVLDLFDVLVDGGEAARLGLAGKPRPDLFLEAVGRLGVPAGRSAVVEDALAGVEAGRDGGFALVVGVDRTAGPGTRERLLRHGAGIVVRDLAELLVSEAPR